MYDELENETITNRIVYLEQIKKSWTRIRTKINYCTEYLIKGGYTQFTIRVEDSNEIAKHIYNTMIAKNRVQLNHRAF